MMDPWDGAGHVSSDISLNYNGIRKNSDGVTLFFDKYNLLYNHCVKNKMVAEVSGLRHVVCILSQCYLLNTL